MTSILQNLLTFALWTNLRSISENIPRVLETGGIRQQLDVVLPWLSIAED